MNNLGFIGMGNMARAIAKGVVNGGAAEPEALEVVEMNLNRPFLFVITGLDGLPLFIGAVNTPQ